MNNLQLEALLNETLSPQLIKDYCPNGLQVEGKVEVKRIVTGVTASMALIEAAIELKADVFWFTTAIFGKMNPRPFEV